MPTTRSNTLLSLKTEKGRTSEESTLLATNIGTNVYSTSHNLSLSAKETTFEEEERGTVKSHKDNRQMTENDNVKLVSGTWVREGDGKWVFDKLTEDGSHYITLKSGLDYGELVQMVKESFCIDTQNVTLKISYQFPTWMQIGDDWIGDDCSTPQFISNNYDVEGFMNFRGNIEKVSLFVTISQGIHGITTAHTSVLHANVSDLTRIRSDGIAIRKRAAITQLASLPNGTRYRGKGRAVEMVSEVSEVEAIPAAPTIGGGMGGQQATGLNTWIAFQDSLDKILIDESNQPLRFARDAPPVVDSVEEDCIGAAFEAIQYEGDDLFVSQVFKSKADCQLKVTIHAIYRKFHFKTQRSTPKSMDLICVVPHCSWRVYAAKVDGTENFQIRQATLRHCCTVYDHSKRHLSKSRATEEIKKWIECISGGPTPATRRKMLMGDLQVNISAWKSWRSHEVSMERVLGSMAGSYALMPEYMSLLQTTNPGSICVENTETITAGLTLFKSAFIAFGASVKGYGYMRKVIIIGGTSLKGRNGGCLMSACAQDGNFQIFPLAFCVVDSENDGSWEWFLKQLQKIVGDSEKLVFVSDRHGRMYTALKEVYPSAYHAACTVHLLRKIKDRFNSEPLESLVQSAARACTVDEFDKKFTDIKSVSLECAEYLIDIGFEHWTRAHFEGDCFNIMDSRIAQSWNSVLMEAREFPLISMCEYIRTTMMTWFALRRAKSMEHKGKLTPMVSGIVEGNSEASTTLVVSSMSEMEFQVKSQSGECFTVNLLAGTCTCKAFEQIRIPCRHAIAAAGKGDKVTESLVAADYNVDTWRSSYEGEIYPIPYVRGTEIGGKDLLPPLVKRSPGRPPKLLILSSREEEGEGRRKEGHNKASWKSTI